MRGDAVDAYVEAYARQSVSASGPEDRVIDEPGIVGVVRDAGKRLSLLVIDDRALGPLNDLQRIGSYGVISVLAAAWRSTAMLVAAPVWAAKPVWAMVCRNLSTVPTPLLPSRSSM
jgi:hypothetical protein